MREQEFKEKLIALCKEYSVKVVEHPSYDGYENYCGSTYSFTQVVNGTYGWSVDVDEYDMREIFEGIL